MAARLKFAKPRKKPRAPRAFNSTLPASRKAIARASWLPRSMNGIRAVNPEAKARREKAFKKFLGSALWKRIRMATFEIDDFTCRKCPWQDESRTGIGLICNHTTYARFGGQEIIGEDTETLCKSCNEKETVAKRANWAQPKRRSTQ